MPCRIGYPMRFPAYATVPAEMARTDDPVGAAIVIPLLNVLVCHTGCSYTISTNNFPRHRQIEASKIRGK